ncbi:MAG: class I SAM-dependent methyltransferase [Acidimicrobiales bacterium]|nr:class I SAM-dependent methyltransferase [Acidimicrobiales bacterium]
MTPPSELPLPPVELRQLVGPTDEARYDNAMGSDVFPDVADKTYGAVFDFGCGCGRIARQLIQQTRAPERYVGLDHHAGMIRWCQQNFTPYAPQFSFVHHDVADRGFNPGADKPATLPFPVKDGEFSFILALSVFTHIVESSVLHYLQECARIMAVDGIVRTTWFLFDKRPFPMMQDFQNAMYINDQDPTNAVIYDREWLVRVADEVGLVITRVTPPVIRGFHWYVDFERASPGRLGCDIPDDVAPFGSSPPPVLPVLPSTVG